MSVRTTDTVTHVSEHATSAEKLMKELRDRGGKKMTDGEPDIPGNLKQKTLGRHY